MPRAPGSPVTDVAVVELPLGVAPLRPIQVFWAVFAALWAWSVTTAVVVYVVTRLLVQHALNNL
jgi:hypothetical protein